MSKRKAQTAAEENKVDSQEKPVAPAEPAANASSRASSKSAKPGFRIEEDLLGKMEVPDDAYYGVHTLRAIENYQISRTTINQVPEFIRGMVQVKKACALANRRLHTLPSKKCEAIVWACDEILEHGRCMDQFPSGSTSRRH